MKATGATICKKGTAWRVGPTAHAMKAAIRKE